MMTEADAQQAKVSGLAEKLKKLLTAVLLLFVGVAVAVLIAQEVRGGGKGEEQVDARVMVYYFHGNYRCETCNTIERLTHETVTERFGEEVGTGLVDVRSVNIDKPGNRHFADRYEIDLEMPRTVIVARFDESGERVDWEPLMRVWDLYNKPEKFKGYIEEAVAGRLPEPQSRPAEDHA